jgi:D-glycero-D-manno-heptose 1,7-bisphosphate phosphatase
VSYVFLDRDGTLVRHVPYLSAPSEIELLPTVVAGLEELLAAGCKLFLHSNQSGIGRGYFSMADAVACNEAMIKRIGLGHELFAEVRLCPETPDGEIAYRKPSPNYAREVMAKYGASADMLCYVGDNVTDLMTAHNVGCAGVGVSTGVPGLTQLLREHGLQHFPVFDTFREAAGHIVNHFRCSRG